MVRLSTKTKEIARLGVVYQVSLFVFFITATMLLQAQNTKKPSSFPGKKYLGETGFYLHFLNDKQVFFNTDTFQYKFIKDTIQLERISWLIGETRQQFRQHYNYQFRFANDHLLLTDLKPSGGHDTGDQTILLRDISSLGRKLTGFKSFTITKQEYVTWSGETDTNGHVIRKETIYVITSLKITSERKLITDVRHRTILQTTTNTTYHDNQISRKNERLSKAAYNKYFNEVKHQYFDFVTGDSQCSEHSLHDTFTFETTNGTKVYNRCWLNELELPIANWISGR